MCQIPDTNPLETRVMGMAKLVIPKKRDAFLGPARSPFFFIDQRPETQREAGPPRAHPRCREVGLGPDASSEDSLPDQQEFSLGGRGWGRGSIQWRLFVRLDCKCDVSLCICIFK